MTTPCFSGGCPKRVIITLSHDIQNELCNIMSNEVLRDIVHDIQPDFYSTIADEYMDITNKEQLSICVRWVDNDLNCYEDFYTIPMQYQ